MSDELLKMGEPQTLWSWLNDKRRLAAERYVKLVGEAEWTRWRRIEPVERCVAELGVLRDLELEVVGAGRRLQERGEDAPSVLLAPLDEV